MEELEKIHVVLLATEVRLEEMVDRTLEEERVVDGDVPHAFGTIPAGLTTSGDGLVHHVVGNEEESLELKRA
jgi:hypothetical protein